MDSFLKQMKPLHILGSVLAFFVALWIIRCIIGWFNIDAFAVGGYTYSVDCKTGCLIQNGVLLTVLETAAVVQKEKFKLDGSGAYLTQSGTKIASVPATCECASIDMQSGIWTAGTTNTDRTRPISCTARTNVSTTNLKAVLDPAAYEAAIAKSVQDAIDAAQKVLTDATLANTAAQTAMTTASSTAAAAVEDAAAKKALSDSSAAAAIANPTNSGLSTLAADALQKYNTAAALVKSTKTVSEKAAAEAMIVEAKLIVARRNVNKLLADKALAAAKSTDANYAELQKAAADANSAKLLADAGLRQVMIDAAKAADAAAAALANCSQYTTCATCAAATGCTFCGISGTSGTCKASTDTCATTKYTSAGQCTGSRTGSSTGSSIGSSTSSSTVSTSTSSSTAGSGTGTGNLNTDLANEMSALLSRYSGTSSNSNSPSGTIATLSGVSPSSTSAAQVLLDTLKPTLTTCKNAYSINWT